jgi:hypothetical protein
MLHFQIEFMGGTMLHWRRFICAFLLILPSSGVSSQSAPATSQWCSKFDNTSEDHRLKATVIQVKRGSQIDQALLDSLKLKVVLQNAIAEIKSTQTPDDLVSTMLESFRPAASDERNPGSGLAMPVDARPGEAQLKASDLLADTGVDALQPVGFFNRFDLKGTGHCGEARIVYAKSFEASRRLFIIFEGKVSPGPNDLECRNVADFWASLVEDQGQSRAEKLRKFYLQGDMGPFGKLASAPMSFNNLGGSERGQVRGDLFINNKWQLREWLLRRHNDKLAFDVVTVKDNPLAELYDVGKLSSFLEKTRGKEEQATFQKNFVEAMVANLARDDLEPERLGPAMKNVPAETRMMHSFNFGNGATSQFDEFQSTSQDEVDRNKPDALFQSAVQAAVQAPKTAVNIFDRAMALTCGGCHQPHGVTRETGRMLQISQGVTWPASLDFVHIDESSELSPALKDHFLPFRAALLKDFLCKPPATTLVFNLQRQAPSFQLNTVRELTDTVILDPSATARSVAQESINVQEQARRRVERSEPGSLWQFRRTH